MSTAALHVITTGDQAARQVAAMLALCEANAWRVVAVSASAAALAALVAAGAVDTVVSATNRPELAAAIAAAGGTLAVLRGESRQVRPSGAASLTAALTPLIAAGKLSHAEAAALLAAASQSPSLPPSPEQRPQRAA